MRNSIKPASLGELLGEGYEHRDKLTLEDLPKLLGEKMPEIPFDRVGKIRLINALQMRFGGGFSDIPGVKNILQEFDKELKVASVIRMNRRKNGNS